MKQKKKKYAYARVSTKDQNIERQILQLRDYVEEKNIYMDWQSGKDFQRPHYQELLKKLRPMDVLYIHSLDRLGRNYEEIGIQWRHITRHLRADIVVLNMPLLDTRCKKDLMGALVSDIVLQVLSFAAESERNNIRQRQAEGIAAAKNKGVVFGRPRMEMPYNYEDIASCCQNGVLSIRAAAAACGVSYSTFYRRLKKMEKMEGSRT